MIWRPAFCLGKRVVLGFTPGTKERLEGTGAFFLLILSNRSWRQIRLKKHTQSGRVAQWIEWCSMD